MKEKSQEESIKLSTKEAIELIDMLKRRVTQNTLQFPKRGEKLEFDVYAVREGEKFTVNVSRGRINSKKCTYQGRTYIGSTPILRLDITNGIHVNSDGTKIIGNHLHIYNENSTMGEAIQFDIENADLYIYCLEFFKKFNILQESCNILYQMELGEGESE